MTTTQITSKSAARKLAALSRKIDRLRAEIQEVRCELPEAANSEQELAPGALMMALDSLNSATSSVSRAAKYLADGRTESEISAAGIEARKAEARDNSLRIYGCAP